MFCYYELAVCKLYILIREEKLLKEYNCMLTDIIKLNIDGDKMLSSKHNLRHN